MPSTNSRNKRHRFLAKHQAGQGSSTSHHTFLVLSPQAPQALCILLQQANQHLQVLTQHTTMRNFLPQLLALMN